MDCFLNFQVIKIRDVAGPSERLSVTIWYLSTGDAQFSIACSFRISPTTFSRIIQETCGNFPQCLGAIDGEHVVTQAPTCSGSEYFNYKKAHSIVLLGACNSRYEFTMVDIGDTDSQLGHAIDRNTINRPRSSPINNSEKLSYTRTCLLQTMHFKSFPAKTLC